MTETKAKHRNFTLNKEADTQLLALAEKSGRTMTTIIEDLLLGRRQFPDELEEFITQQMDFRGLSRQAVIEAALAAEKYRLSSKSPVSAAEKALQRKHKASRSNSLKAPHALKSPQG